MLRDSTLQGSIWTIRYGISLCSTLSSLKLKVLVVILLTAGINGDVGSIAVLQVGLLAEGNLGGNATLLEVDWASHGSHEAGGGSEDSRGSHLDGLGLDFWDHKKGLGMEIVLIESLSEGACECC